MKNKVLELVKAICSTDSTDCRGLNHAELARELMNLANIPENAEIQETPLDWNNQVVVLFLIPGDKNYYSLFAGIGNDNKFYFELTITGILKDNGYFDFFDEEKKLDIDYFKTTEKLYVTYEETEWNAQGERLVLDENGMKKMYEESVDKEEYAFFDFWLWDMLRSGVFSEDYPTYRVDSFGKKHTKKYFYYLDEAEEYAKEEVNKAKTVYLLEHVVDAKYDVIKVFE